MFGKNKNELNPPPISKEKGTFEILRVWAGTDMPQQLTLETTWTDPGTWGLVLVDIARHVAKAYSNKGNITEEEALSRIKQLFDVEWESPTDVPEQLMYNKNTYNQSLNRTVRPRRLF